MRLCVGLQQLTIALVPMLTPLGAFAQTPAPGEPPENVRMRIGPLYVSPTIALTNAGVDTNVFNEPNQLEPKKDFTLTIIPATNFWLRFGHTWLTGNIAEDLVYYNKYASERSANTSYRSNWVIPLNRLLLNPGISYLNTRDRPGFEIDARSQRTEIAYNAAIELRAFPKTFLGARGERRQVNFDKAAVFLGTSLHDELTRTITVGGLTVRHQLTPLTSLTLDISREHDQFAFSPLRNSDSTMISGGVKLDPFALIKGSASFGYRKFDPLSPGLPGYQGSMAAVDLSYVALGTTRIGLQAARDLQYSYDVRQPYYVNTGISGSIDQEVLGPVAVTGRIGTQRLDYRDRAGTMITLSNRIDHVHMYGGGVSYRVSRDVHVELNIDKQSRESPVAYRLYDGMRFGLAVKYGQ